MPRFPKRLLLLSGLAAGAARAVKRKRAAASAPAAPSAAGATASSSTPPPAPTSTSPAPPPSTVGVQTPLATPPVETPGPSVTPPAVPGSETERAERADATTPDPAPRAGRGGSPADRLVEAETAAAAAEAAAIGGPHFEDAPDGDPAMEPVYEAGGGEQEGFELAERDLIENASHGGGRGDPLHDRPSPEIESDESTAVYGEPDEEKISEVVRDPTSKDPDDPGIGPGVTHER